MEVFSRILLAIMLLNTAAALIEPRKVLKIPEKIIGGVIDMVQNHKNKPTQGYQSQVQVQGTQQYTAWNPTANQYQGHQHTNYGNYLSGTHAPTTGQIYPQGNYGGTQTQGQYQGNGQQSGQFQAQNQNYNGQTQNQFQGQQNNFQAQNQVQLAQNQYGVNQPNFVQGQNQYQNHGQYGNSQNQMQVQSGQYGQNAGQNYQSPQLTGQNHQYGQFTGQNTQLQGSSSASGTAQAPQFTGQHTQFQGPATTGGTVQAPQFTEQNTHFQAPVSSPGTVQIPQFSGHNSHYQGPPVTSQVTQMQNGQNGVYQGSGTQQPTSGPTCVCQAWTKDPNGPDGAGKSEEVTEKNTINPDS